MNWNNKIVLVTGSSSFLGFHMLKELKKLNPKQIITSSSQETDLRINSNCKKIVKNVNIIIHLAGNAGGIGYMKENPADIFYDNVMMSTQLMHEAKQAQVEKFLALGTICSYPKISQIPFSEENIWDGFPEEINSAYGLAKKMMMVQSDAYRKQYGFKSINVIPTNLYGPNDDFNLETCNVIPAIILKIYNAKLNNRDSITLWGDGTPTRDFLFVEDAVRGIILATEKYNDSTPINLSSEEEISIKYLANLISELMSFTGKIIWDISKPNGQPRRCVSNKKAKKELGFQPQTSLKNGLKQTIDWFYSQQQ